jgi:predicted nucleic acid-binding protein
LSSDPGLVVVDTGVFAAALGSDRLGLATLYAADLQGKKLAISFQTEAEVRFGALAAGWGSPRLDALDDRLAMAVVVPAHAALTVAYAELRNDCRKTGHALQDGKHAADLWIASTALLLSAPLVTHDRIFIGVPTLTVICHA